MKDLKYPIGKYEPSTSYSGGQEKEWIKDIKLLPDQLDDAVYGLSEKQLNTPYRPEGWTVRQLIHHIADSHINAYCRTKWALTEESTTIKPYDQEKWAKLDDYEAPVSVSLDLIRSLHSRWGQLLDGLNEEDLMTEYNHPESGKIPFWRHLEHYSWHGLHHLAHILELKKRENWM